MTQYTFVPMTLPHVIEIETWRYEGYMKEIYMKPYHENYDPEKNIVKGPANCDGFAVYRHNQLIGLFEYYLADDRMEIGLALNPSFVGKGLSTSFIEAGIDHISQFYQRTFDPIWLSVEKENKSAYYAYLKAGFMVDYESDSEYVMKKQIRT